MTQIEKMELFIRAMKREVELEFKPNYRQDGKEPWVKLMWDEELNVFFVKGTERFWNMANVLSKYCELRIAKSLPLLSDADADFAEKYLPHDWWITKDEDMKSCVEIHNIKPKRDADMWIQGSNAKQILVQLIFNFPKFESIKWENDDCYTIQELLDYYKENKK